ncbi:MAG: N-acetylglucosamine-6-phosphate deacetylase [Acetivibrionales bacterium]|jgi:N-acetylglucosamine-6-phosphate deacetylase|nr:N-acetylglucosamine-6-phosphate deacetylase [Clostridiaceae bacterium]
MDLYVKNGDVFINGTFIKANITVKGGKIVSLSDENLHGLPELDASGKRVVPGFIDIHTHGANGVDINHANSQDISNISSFFASQGTTSWIASIVTDTEENTLWCIEQIKEAINNPDNGAQLLGTHLEGPFLDPQFRGSMAEHLLKKGEYDLFKKFYDAADGTIKYITVSPEVDGVLELIKEIRKLGIVVAIGHSGADYDTTMEAINNGATCVTHIFNGMKAMHHHSPNIAGAVLESDIYCEAICDGRHLHPGVVRLIIKTKGLDRVVAVTDSITATGLPDGEYYLGVNKVRVTNGDARLVSNDVRAGSTLTTNKALQNLVEFTGRKLEEIIPLLTKNPATVMNIIDSKGTLDVGKDADIVLLDDALNVDTTIVGGTIAYKR